MPIAFPGPMGMKLNPDFARVAASALPMDALLVVGCKSGQRSAMACQLLRQSGFTRAINMAGGFLGSSTPGWAACGLPSTRDPTPGKSWAELNAGSG